MSITLTQSVAKIHYTRLKITFNVRYGLDESRLLDAYQKGIGDLKDSILKFGFKPNEPIEVYEGELDDEGNPIYYITEGHRRYLASLSIFQEFPGKSLGDDLAPGEVRIYVSPKPEDVLKLVSSQIGANRTEPNTKMDLCKAIDAAFNSIDGKKTEKLKQIGEELAMTRQTVDSHYNAYQLPTEVKDWIQESEINDDIDITLSFTVASEMVNYYKVEDASRLLLKALEIVQNEPGTVKTFGKSITRDWLYELATKIKLGKKPPAKRGFSQQDDDGATDSEGSVNPVDNKTTVDANENMDQSVEADINDTLPINTTEPTTSSDATVNIAQQTQTPTKKGTSISAAPIERIETRIRQALKGDIGVSIANSTADVTRNVLIIELPLDKGAEFAELVSAFIDPVSNPPEEIIDATSVVNDMEF